MSSEYIKVAEKTFEAELYRHGSWGSRDVGKHSSTMTLYFRTGKESATGFIDWSIPSLEEEESIGLWFDVDVSGKRTLCDYDGIMAMPVEAVDLMREAGIIVPDEFDDRVSA